MITIREVSNKNDMKAFSSFPSQLYKNNPYYVPSFLDDNFLFNPTRNPSYVYCECRLFICVDGDKVLGRVATIINHRYNEEHNVKELRYFKLTVVDSFEATTRLMNQVKKVAVENNLTSIVGEMGFTQLSHYGLLLEGFDDYAVYDSQFNFPYYIDHLKKLNFRLDKTWNSYRLTVPSTLDKRNDGFRDVILKRYNLKLSSITNMKKNPDLPEIISKSMSLRLKNFDYFYSFNSINEEEMDDLVNKFKMIIQFTNINSCYYYVITDKDDEVVGFVLGIPSLAKFLSKQKAVLSPSISRLYNKAYNKGDSIDLLSIVIKKEYQNLGIIRILKNELLKSCIESGVKYINTDLDFDLLDVVKDEFRDLDMKKLKTFGSYRFDLIN